MLDRLTPEEFPYHFEQSIVTKLQWSESKEAKFDFY